MGALPGLSRDYNAGSLAARSEDLVICGWKLSVAGDKRDINENIILCQLVIAMIRDLHFVTGH
jgi:hypothetical protein